MPRATMTSATIASSSVKPACSERRIGRHDRELAIELRGQGEAGRVEVAADLGAERRELAARKHEHLRLGLLEKLLVELLRQPHVAFLEDQTEPQRLGQRVPAQQPVARWVDPQRLRVVVDIEAVTRLAE